MSRFEQINHLVGMLERENLALQSDFDLGRAERMKLFADSLSDSLSRLLVRDKVMKIVHPVKGEPYAIASPGHRP